MPLPVLVTGAAYRVTRDHVARRARLARTGIQRAHRETAVAWHSNAEMNILS